MNTKYNELEDRYEVDPQSIVGSELLNVETPNKYVTYAGLERAVKNVLSKAKDYDKGLVGGYNGSFPLTAATKGNIYLLPATKKYYVCITDYSGSQLTAPNANFEELSVYTNRSKLDNLSTKYFKFKYNESEDQEINSILLLNFINKCLESAKNIDILILGGNNKICSIDAKLIVSRATSVIHLTIWNFLSLTINHLELNSDDNNSITINRSGHNLILWNSSWDLWNSRHNTWNIIGGYWW